MNKLKEYLIRDWRSAYQFVSVQIAALMALLSLAEPYIPVLHQYMPEHWVPVASGLIIVSRLIQQKKVAKDVKDALLP
jgi:hypothetical protein